MAVLGMTGVFVYLFSESGSRCMQEIPGWPWSVYSSRRDACSASHSAPLWPCLQLPFAVGGDTGGRRRLQRCVSEQTQAKHCILMGLSAFISVEMLMGLWVQECNRDWNAVLSECYSMNSGCVRNVWFIHLVNFCKQHACIIFCHVYHIIACINQSLNNGRKHQGVVCGVICRFPNHTLFNLYLIGSQCCWEHFFTIYII